jgi:hypothetical protein
MGTLPGGKNSCGPCGSQRILPELCQFRRFTNRSLCNGELGNSGTLTVSGSPGFANAVTGKGGDLGNSGTVTGELRCPT